MPSGDWCTRWPSACTGSPFLEGRGYWESHPGLPGDVPWEVWEIRKILAQAIPERAFSPLDGITPQGSEDRRTKERRTLPKPSDTAEH